MLLAVADRRIQGIHGSLFGYFLVWLVLAFASQGSSGGERSITIA